MNDPELGAAYRNAFTGTEDDAVRRMRAFVKMLPPGHGAPNRGTRWLLPVGVAAAVVAVAVTGVALTGGGSHPAVSAGTPPSGAQPSIVAGSGTHRSVSPTTSPSSTASSNPLTTRTPLSTPPDGPTSHRSAAPTVAPKPPRLTVSSNPSPASTRAGSPVMTTPGAPGRQSTSTSPQFGDSGITGPLTPYAKASAYSRLPAGLIVRTPADSVSFQNGVATEFSMYISAPSANPKVVVGGYVVTVAAPSVHYRSIDGQGPSSTPAGAALRLGDRLWRWNADHTLLIWTSADAEVYIGVLATRAMNEFEPTIPGGYSAADIELIAAGLRG